MAETATHHDRDARPRQGDRRFPGAAWLGPATGGRWPATPRSAATTGWRMDGGNAVLMDAPPPMENVRPVRARSPAAARSRLQRAGDLCRRCRAGPAAARGSGRRHLHPPAARAAMTSARSMTLAIDRADRAARRRAGRAMPACRPSTMRAPARGVAAARLVLAGDTGGAATPARARELRRRLARGLAEAPRARPTRWCCSISMSTI